ncbi:hypothetical protein PUNSTDRAFT_69040 [Punctularia strigosozonata HHB-11173 SS5]|uniref:uncharacterized protein n=1 Tax=Punctularia strigosozonata (strain HHB-11173) TaxID=741275 RepID=UPI0004417087|nr:uncharacterized protein PUNSTDRAFT_69040 [Punctularia strigosozonata HHB-11173 SS5]EIN08501.1 hypothetical protein PUNSTDRAFT_69040 [Punctularia strigosozonata HHB-11173 SS5]
MDFFLTQFSLHFVSFSPTILSCDVVDSNGGPRYAVRTELLNGTLVTTVTDALGRALAILDWKNKPAVEISGHIGRQAASEWLVRSENGSSRTMELGAMHYRWVTHEDNLCLTMHLRPGADVLCRVTKTRDMITLELTQNAIVIGLELPAIVATMLLMSGRNID